jgi:hypothetical protein
MWDESSSLLARQCIAAPIKKVKPPHALDFAYKLNLMGNQLFSCWMGLSDGRAVSEPVP